MTAHHDLLAPIPAGVPAELRAVNQWVCWKGRPNGRGALDKVPVSPHTGAVCDALAPAAWGRFDEALAAMRRHRLDGIGIVITDEDRLVGVDLDHCLDDGGAVASWARAIVAALDTYTERSPSGRGLRLFAYGGLPAGRRKRGGIELYDRARFLTVTGRHLEGTPATVEDRDWELRDLHARWLGAGAHAPDEDAPHREGGAATEPPVRLDGAGLAAWRGERPARRADGAVDRSRTLYALACVLARAGATPATIAMALAERDRALGLRKYSERPDGGAGEYRRMAARAARESEGADEGRGGLAQLAAEQRRLAGEVARLGAALRALGAPAGSAREGKG